MNIVLYSREVLRTNHRSKNNRLFYLAIGSTLILLFYALYVLPHYSACFSLPNSNNSLGLSFGYGIRTATQFFETRTEEQRFCYAHFICIWDNIFTLVYTITHTLWLIFLFKRWRFFLALPLLHMSADWIENYIELAMVNTYNNSHNLPEPLISSGSLATQIKWCLSIVLYLFLVYGILVKYRAFKTFNKH